MGTTIAVFQRNTVCFNGPESPPKAQPAGAVGDAAQRKAGMCTVRVCACSPSGEQYIPTRPCCITCQTIQEFLIFVSAQGSKPVSIHAFNSAR